MIRESAARRRGRDLRSLNLRNRTKNTFEYTLNPPTCQCAEDICRCDMIQIAQESADEISRRAMIVKEESLGHLARDPRDDDPSRYGVVAGVGFDREFSSPDSVVVRLHRAELCRKLIRAWKRRARLYRSLSR